MPAAPVRAKCYRLYDIIKGFRLDVDGSPSMEISSFAELPGDTADLASRRLMPAQWLHRRAYRVRMLIETPRFWHISRVSFPRARRNFG